MPAPGELRTRKWIALSGFMGAGKTTVGRALAQQIGWRFVDLDSRIEEHAGLTISAIFDRLGEPAFRQMESEILSRTLGESAERDQPLVLALGGGTFSQPQNATLLRSMGVAVIWLDCPLEELFARCATMTNRPLFRDETGFRMLFRERLPSYEQADYRVPSNTEPRQVVEHILTLGILERVNA